MISWPGLCGNGGSAADCEHWSGEMLKGFEGDRPVSAAMRARLGEELADKLQGALPVIPLPGFLSLSSAYANDCHSAYIFAQLTLALGSAGDVLVAISTSGNSENVLYAVETAQALDLKVLGLTGGSGGRLKPTASRSCTCRSITASRLCWSRSSSGIESLKASSKQSHLKSSISLALFFTALDVDAFFCEEKK